jgi:hypothetical protein
LVAGLTIQPLKRLWLRNTNRGGQGPYWAVELYDDDDDSYVNKNSCISTPYGAYSLSAYKRLNKGLADSSAV